MPRIRQFQDISADTFEVRLDIIATQVDAAQLQSIVEEALRLCAQGVNGSSSLIRLCPSFDTMTVSKVEHDLGGAK
tara:strand:+ start:322 stop:549 length:228 start_codon:yes stop_codon:yes gene_type:complete